MQQLLLILDNVSFHCNTLSTWVIGKILMTYFLAGVFGPAGITRLTTQGHFQCSIRSRWCSMGLRTPLLTAVRYYTNWSVSTQKIHCDQSRLKPTLFSTEPPQLYDKSKSMLKNPLMDALLTIHHRYQTDPPTRWLFKMQHRQLRSNIHVHYPATCITAPTNSTVPPDPDLSYFPHLGSPSSE